MRSLLRSAAMRRVLCWLVAAYIRLVGRTSRFETRGDALARSLWDDRSPFILAFWHGRLLLAPLAWRDGARMNMLISAHPDGRIIADAIGHFGLGTITGSSRKDGAGRDKGGAAALRAMLRALRAGENVGVTPDGPHGPRMRATPGIVAAARLSGAPILPLTFATTRRRILGSWDRFHLALPFSRGIFLWGEPIRVARDADAATLEAARAELEDLMNALTAEADRLCGHVPVEPEAASPGLLAAS